MWELYEQLITDNGAIVLFASGQFLIKLINSNKSLYRYKYVWIKNKKTNFVNAKNKPMTKYEEILVFSKGVTANGCKNKMKYYPQGLIPCNRTVKRGISSVYGKRPSHKKEIIQKFTNYPCDVLYFNCVSKPIHPNEKPVDLLEYLIKTYTNEGEIVLDNCMGSGSTGVACVNTNRRFIGIELDENYFNIAEKRIRHTKTEE